MTHPTCIARLALLLVFTLAVCTSDAADPVQQVGKRLKDFGWYDSEKDGLRDRAYPGIPNNDPSNRTSAWERDIQDKVPTPSNGGATPFALGESGSVLINSLAWALLAMLVVGIASGLAWSLVRNDRDDDFVDVEEEVVEETEAERVERLPFHIQAARTDLMGEVRRHMEQGNYSQATVYLYSFMLVELDKYQVLRLEPGRTNRMYIRDVRPYPPLAMALNATVGVFEDAFFGKKVIDRARFEQCWNLLPSFQAFLASGGQT